MKAIKNVLRLKKNLNFEHEADSYKPVRVGNFWSNNDIEYKSKGDREALSVKKYLSKIK